MFTRKGGRRFCLMKTMTRREFLRAGVGLAAVAGGLGTICGCAMTDTPKVKTLVYPPLPYHKIQPPQEGCLIGFFKEPDPTRYRITNVEIGITYIEGALSAKPYIYSLPWSRLYAGFPMAQAIQVAKKNIIPYVYATLTPHHSPIRISGFSPGEIVQGQHDGSIKKFAQGAAEFGKEYGGFFITTMEEMNGNWFSWGKNSNFIPAWRRIWQIFEDQGANQYATWVWAVTCPEGLPSHMVDDPKLYYPGDRYIDWIGLCAFSVAEKPTLDLMLNVLLRETYRRFFKNHPQKPFMVSAFGRTNESYQYRWLSNAYRSIKSSFPAIKAVIYHDNVWWGTGDHTLNNKGLETLKEIFRDPYWIMAK
jgi:hypothetical protein